MGNDTALAVLSDQRPPLFSYFKQLFAQVTNPPIDPIRESIVMSLGTGVGAEGNLLDETPEHAHQLVMDQPILRNHELETLRQVATTSSATHTIDITWPWPRAPTGCRRAWPASATRPTTRVAAGVNILILSDRRDRPRARADPVAAGRRRGAPPPRARGHAPAGRARARVRRAARGPPLRDADRLRRERDQPVPAVRHASTSSSPRAASAGVDRRRRRRAQRRQGDRQGPAQDDLQDGDLDDPVLLRRADLRGRRPGAGRSSTATSPAPRRGSAASASTSSRRRRSTATRGPGPAATTTCCPSAASTPGAATASTTCGTRRRSRCCSTRSARQRQRAGEVRRVRRAWSTRTPRAARRCAAC